ncbi:AAA family ATPase [Rhodococcus hoagii]|nr:AAA family ATPase [Prescottella equi]
MHTQTDHKALAAELRAFRTEYDYIVIDTQGSASAAVLAAIRAANDVIVPTAPAGTDIQNLPDALDFIYQINERQEALDQPPVRLHVLLVRMDMRTNSARNIRENLRPIIADYVGVELEELPESTPHVMTAEVGSRAEIMDSFGRVPATDFYKPVVDELLSIK